MKKLYFSVIILILPIVFASCFGANENTTETNTDLSVTVLKTGKSDAIIITDNGHTMLIDTAESEDSDKITDYLNDANITTIDYLVITHLDKDHVGGAASVIETVNVKKVYQSPNSESSEEYRAYLDALTNSGITAEKVTEKVNLTLGDAEITLLSPQKVYYENDNEYSVMVSLKYGDTSFLFAADALGERLEEYLADTTDTYDFLKVPHHGRVDKSTEKFVESVDPQYAVITSSKNKKPDNEVINILNNHGVETYLTVEGTVTAVSDGKTIKISQNKK